MVHKIATGYGISSCSYAADASIPPLQGILQGNGNGPSGWALISSPLFDMLRDIGFGAEIIAVLSQEISFLAGFGFVDDVDLVVTGDSSNVMQKAQEGLTIWEACLKATGGALQVDKNKSFWYGIDFVWSKRKWRYKTIEEFPGNLYALNENDTLTTLHREEPTKANETLGTWLSPDGNETEQIAQLLCKSRRFAELIRVGRISQEDAMKAMKSTIWKSLEYPMATTSF